MTLCVNIDKANRSRLDQHLSSVRDLEERLVVSGERKPKPKPETTTAEPMAIFDKAKFFPKREACS